MNELHQKIVSGVGQLKSAGAARSRLIAAKADAERLLGDDPDRKLGSLEETKSHCEREVVKCGDILARWEEFRSYESFWLQIFSFLSMVKRRRVLKARVHFRKLGYEGTLDGCPDIDAMEAELRRRKDESGRSLKSASVELNTAKEAMAKLERTREEYARIMGEIGAVTTDPEDFGAQERMLDCDIRFNLFLLATHYWEGRWLIEMNSLLKELDDEKKKRGEKIVMNRWRRRMMLTPCMVSTFAALPAQMTYSKRGDDDFQDEYLYNFIDLLIVDEAGQVLPEVAGASFALAKKALVIGDTKQIEPIASLPKPVDAGNLAACGILSDECGEEEWDRIGKLGIISTGGSAMRVAQSACRYQAEPDLDRGLYLFEHRRCYDEIISFCNSLCYKGKLIPKRGSALNLGPEDPLAGFRPLTYLHVDGISSSFGGSRVNPVEAKVIADWLSENRGQLESGGGRLEEIVGVVTPFSRQARAIRDACKEKIDVGGAQGMAVGTIHSLQGADRKVIIFSPTYSKHFDGEFIDMSDSMLNVAVSRARDCFMVFGDMDLFSAARRGTPRRRLAEFLFADPDNALEYDVPPRDDLKGTEHEFRVLRDSKGHDEFLLELLNDPGYREIRIVSPWIVIRSMENAGVLSAIDEAARQGRKIQVYVDPILSGNGESEERSNLQQARAALREAGVELMEVRQIHSKLVIADDSLLAVGSYNWLSAARAGRYARHETTFVYEGSHLSREIEAITETLQRMVTPMA